MPARVTLVHIVWYEIPIDKGSEHGRKNRTTTNAGKAAGGGIQGASTTLSLAHL
jgi:hypothetical protein